MPDDLADTRIRAGLVASAPDVPIEFGASARGPARKDVQPDHLRESASSVSRALEPFVEQEWDVPARDLTWDVRQTLTHTIDAVGWYSAQLASQSPRRLRFDFRAHRAASNADLLDVLQAAAATLAQVATAAPAGARGYHSSGLADVTGFLAMGCDEILVHGWDAIRGLGSEFNAPTDVAERVLRRLFPWAPDDVPSWPGLLWANGRLELPGRPRIGPDWAWHCAPLDEWDATVPR